MVYNAGEGDSGWHNFSVALDEAQRPGTAPASNIGSGRLTAADADNPAGSSMESLSLQPEQSAQAQESVPTPLWRMELDAGSGLVCRCAILLLQA